MRHVVGAIEGLLALGFAAGGIQVAISSAYAVPVKIADLCVSFLIAIWLARVAARNFRPPVASR